uniref:Uncharacterized protein n=1 Tax=Microviridae sp. ctLZT1 TaxID=2824992 RepID=A0A8S5UKE4_9VIRU|nr:MAG TPA: hypothetical protein [Microviridae sp. ctLZT1]
MIYLAQLTHWSACVNRSECGAPCAPLSNNSYKATALRSSQLRFAFLSILSLIYRKHQSMFFLFSFETCNKTMRRIK